MEYAQHFFDGLDGPASLTFLGLLATSFLIGLLPAGLMYLARLRRAERRIERLVDALQQVKDERDALASRLTASEATAADLDQRLRSSVNARTALQSDLSRLREESGTAAREAARAEAEWRTREQLLESLRNRNATLTAQVQSLKSSARNARPSVPTVFDADVMSSLSRERARADALEARIEQVTADNEELRARLTGSGVRAAAGKPDRRPSTKRTAPPTPVESAAE